MSQKPKKYPFFIRLKRAWAVYNEYMPTSTQSENGRKKLRLPNQTTIPAHVMEKVPPIKLTTEQKVHMAKMVDERLHHNLVQEKKQKVKHTLVKKSDLERHFEIGQVYWEADRENIFHIQEIEPNTDDPFIFCRYPLDNRGFKHTSKVFKDLIKQGKFQYSETIPVKPCKHCGEIPKQYFINGTMCKNIVCIVNK